MERFIRAFLVFYVILFLIVTAVGIPLESYYTRKALERGERFCRPGQIKIAGMLGPRPLVMFCVEPGAWALHGK